MVVGPCWQPRGARTSAAASEKPSEAAWTSRASPLRTSVRGPKRSASSSKTDPAYGDKQLYDDTLRTLVSKRKLTTLDADSLVAAAERDSDELAVAHLRPTNGRNSSRLLEATLKAQRAKERKKKFEAAGSQARGYLQRSKVSQLTQERYTMMAAGLYLTEGVRQGDAPELLDAALDRQLLKRFLAGEAIAQARYLVHGVKWHNNLNTTALPKAFGALAGYKAGSRERMRDPNVWEAVVWWPPPQRGRAT